MPTRIFFQDVDPRGSIVVSEELDTVLEMVKSERTLDGVGVLTDYESRDFDRRVIVYLRNITHARAERVRI